MQKTIKALAVLLVFCLTACASAGVKVDQSKMSQFQKGKTTEADVVAALGQPTNSEQNDDGTNVIRYVYSSTQARPETFIPIVGAFVGGADTEQTVASFTFDQKNILIRSSHSQGGLGVGTNLEGMSQERKDVRAAE
jgi:hypothetical protein